MRLRTLLAAALAACVVVAPLGAPAAVQDLVRAKDLGRFMGPHDNALVGYGVVIGLAGSGDSPRNEITQQAVKNVLSRFGANLSVDQIRSRNVAAVMVTASIPPASAVGDHLDVNVSSIGDARSLLGGSLLMTPLLGADQRAYAVAQGSVVVGGYRFDADRNVEQKNHPTSGVVPGGATVETSVAEAGGDPGYLTFLLKDPDATTAARLADGVNSAIGPGTARVRDAKSILISTATARGEVYRLIARVENVSIRPDTPSRVVVNERSGTVVAGGGVQISSVVIAQGDLKVSVTVENQASQPGGEGGYGYPTGARSLVVSNTKLKATEGTRDAVARFPSTTVADLVQGLSRLHVRPREMIAVLEAMRAAGALHAEIIVQ